MKALFTVITFLCISLSTFSLHAEANLKNLKVLPRSEIFFTKTENCYALELPDIIPARVQLELPELPLGTKFISSKKEEFISDTGSHGTLITLWFNFDYQGETRIPPLPVKIDGKSHYFEFTRTVVYENPALISPVIEVAFKDHKNERMIKLCKGESLFFTVSIRYAVQIMNFNWQIPKDSIFTETERFDFANGKQKITEFTTDSKSLASFEWKILKSGTYPLPRFNINASAFNGQIKRLSLPKEYTVTVTEENYAQNQASYYSQSSLFSNAFEHTEESSDSPQKDLPSDYYKRQAENTKLSFFDKLFGIKRAVFAGGEISSVPEGKASSQKFSGGRKVKICEQVGSWSFIECEDFSGWTNTDNLFLIK